MITRLKELGIAVLALAFAAPLAQAALVIDDFATTQDFGVSGGPGAFSANTGIAASSIGGNRNITINHLTGSGSDHVAINASGNGLLAFTSDANDTASAVMLYDGGTGNTLNPTGLGGIDLTQSGTDNALSLSYRAGLAGTPVTIDIYTDAAHASRATFTTAATGFGANPLALENLLYSGFSPLVGTGATFSNVGAVVITIDGSSTPALDVQLAAVTSVPEPAGLALLGTLGLVLRRRR